MIMSRPPLSQYQSYSHGYGKYGPPDGGSGPPPRTVPCAHTVAPPALTHSADATGAAMMPTGVNVAASPNNK
jgi:hypothetical protein